MRTVIELRNKYKVLDTKGPAKIFRDLRAAEEYANEVLEVSDEIIEVSEEANNEALRRAMNAARVEEIEDAEVVEEIEIMVVEQTESGKVE
jgi:hypothetical protein